MLHGRRTPERLSGFSDGVFAVLITVLVLDLRPPEFPTFKSLLSLWPTWLSYLVSYLFIAIVWTNHHHLMRYATEATPNLVWFNFAHLFSVSLLPLSTAWMAVTELAPQPVAFYAAVFFLVNATYICLIYELIDRAAVDDVLPRERRIMHFRSITTLCVFAAAAVVALKYPLFGLGMCICCLIVYLKPEAPGARSEGPGRLAASAYPQNVRFTVLRSLWRGRARRPLRPATLPAVTAMSGFLRRRGEGVILSRPAARPKSSAPSGGHFSMPDNTDMTTPFFRPMRKDPAVPGRTGTISPWSLPTSHAHRVYL